ncbi:MAG: hypothetical protein HY062_01380 [Bacteroidetes bacterium]|nr:hypothetical protein [Bacteroidota bacterium]
MYRITYILLLIVSLSLQTNSFSQIKDPVFIRETNISIKAGTCINTVNSALYKKLNTGLSSDSYIPTHYSYFVNPYASIGLEYHFMKHMAVHFNIGFYQTLQKYKSNLYSLPQAANTVPNNTITYTADAETQYLHNNVFLEALPAYVFHRTRFLGGLNITRSSPSVSTVVTITDQSNGQVTRETLKDKPEESYHVYSIIGVMQAFPIKSYELTASISYFGLLKKYDSGVNILLGFMF